MHGLTVRWSLKGADAATLGTLKTYVHDESYDVFGKLEGLRFKTWRARDGEWFEGTYVFASSEARDAFESGFRGRAAEVYASVLLGSEPVLIEPFEVVAVVEGPEGFLAAPAY